MDEERPSSKEFARLWRNHPTLPEEVLWRALRGGRSGFKFSRKIRVGPYYVDFCCRQHRFVVEVDGESHERSVEEDAARDQGLRERGYEVLRVSNERVMNELESVVRSIREALESRPRWRY